MRNSRGFTFIELTMVLVVLGFVMTLSFPLLSGFGGSLKQSSRKISGIIRSLYYDAITKQTVFRLNYDIGDNTYWVSRLEPHGYIVEEKRINEENWHLPAGVEFEDIRTLKHGKKNDGTLFTEFYPEGWMDATEIRLKTENGVMSLLIDPATAEVEVREGYVELGDIVAEQR